MSQSRDSELPPALAARVQELVEILRKGGDGAPGSAEQYDAAIELGEIALQHGLPEKAVSALERRRDDPGVTIVFGDYISVGGGMSKYSVGEGARVALLMLRLRDLPSDQERMQLLWGGMSGPEAGHAMMESCIDRLVEFKDRSVFPYLVAAATMEPDRSWYAPRRAVVRLGDFYPEAAHVLLLLSKSQDITLASMAKEQLERKGAPLVVRSIFQSP